MIDGSKIARGWIARGALVAALAGCHGGGGPQAPAQPAAATCAQLPAAVNGALPGAPPDYLNALDDVVVQRCTQDAWSDAARRCISSAKSHQDIQTCKLQLTDAQRAAIEHDSDAAIERVREQTGEQLDDSDNYDSGGGPAMPAVAPPPPPPPAPPAPISPAPTAPRPMPVRAPARDADPCAGGK